MAGAWIGIGRVRSVNPRAREVRVEVRAPYSGALGSPSWIGFARDPAPVLRCKVERVRGEGAVMVVVLGAGLPRDAVAGLRGAEALLAPDDIPVRSAGAWRIQDLLGMAVVAADGSVIGAVCEVYEGPANDAFAVARPDGTRCLLPAIGEVILGVDREARRIEVGDVTPFMVDA
ncbi:MAG: PRC-barrel domain-containing protein [Candidatus Hydrogenedentes bacterium]|nr:PRC-barrel domain-containing protein [Candidatus Hydrogenedentota bacterium]